jgi:SAM-dependent methyltransferase
LAIRLENYRDFLSGDTFSQKIILRSNAVTNSLRRHLHSVAGRSGHPLASAGPSWLCPLVPTRSNLWHGLLAEAYGDEVGEDPLFLQHTYLTIVVKAIAARVLDLPVDNPADLLAGRALADEGIIGAVEADFFDWPLRHPAGEELIRDVAQQTARFRLRDVEADVLKILYESLVDPEQRHDLGEYYTPDWLAGRVVAATVDDPLHLRVLDPACGSGTFLFHAVRHLIAAGQAAGWPGTRILEACADNVRGLDVHPVAVTLARVTWLLALGNLLEDRPAKLSVPVFLGDAMQWNLRRFVDSADVLVEVPGDDRPLQIPAGFAEDQALFEQALDILNQGLVDGASDGLSPGGSAVSTARLRMMRCGWLRRSRSCRRSTAPAATASGPLCSAISFGRCGCPGRSSWPMS